MKLFRTFFISTLKVNSQQQSNEYNQYSKQSLHGEDVVVEDAGEEDTHGLPGDHYQSKHNRTESTDGVEDEELANC